MRSWKGVLYFKAVFSLVYRGSKVSKMRFTLSRFFFKLSNESSFDRVMGCGHLLINQGGHPADRESCPGHWVPAFPGMTKTGYPDAGTPQALSILVFETLPIRFWIKGSGHQANLNHLLNVSRIPESPSTVRRPLSMAACGPRR